MRLICGRRRGRLGKCMVCEGDCFLKASNATRPIQRDDASIVPYKLLEVLP